MLIILEYIFCIIKLNCFEKSINFKFNLLIFQAVYSKICGKVKIAFYTVLWLEHSERNEL